MVTHDLRLHLPNTDHLMRLPNFWPISRHPEEEGSSSRCPITVTLQVRPGHTYFVVQIAVSYSHSLTSINHVSSRITLSLSILGILYNDIGTVQHNVTALQKQIMWTGTDPRQLGQLRLSGIHSSTLVASTSTNSQPIDPKTKLSFRRKLGT